MSRATEKLIIRSLAVTDLYAINIPPFLKNDMHIVMWVKVPDHESNLSCCLACMTLVECQHTVTSFTSISRLRDFYDNLVYVTHYEKNKSHFHYHTR